MSYELRAGDRIVVTGAAGFIGSAVTRALLEREAQVVAMLEPGAASANLDGLEVERHTVDITKPQNLEGAFDGARFCFHLAAKFGFWPMDPTSFYAVNVQGSRNVVAEATKAGVERIVYTSTVATLGLWRTKAGTPSTEDDVADLSHLYGNYKQTKYVAEHEVLRLAAQGAPVVLVLPTMPHGPYDHRPTPSGKVVLDYLNGAMPGYVDTAMNVAHVDDLAAAGATGLGLGLFLAFSSPRLGTREPNGVTWLVTSAVVVGVVLTFVVAGSKGSPLRRALALGAGASVGFALLAAITKSMTDRLVAGWGPLFTSWQLYALAVLGLSLIHI